MNIEEYTDKMDTFSNSLVTHSTSISNLSLDLVKNGQTLANELNKMQLTPEMVILWNTFMGNIDSFMESVANFMEDFKTYDDLVVEALNIDDEK
jgi:hypothetical protein